MSTATEPKFIPAPMSSIPTTGIIHIRPYPAILIRDQQDKNKTWGIVRRSGYMTINGQAVEGWNYMGHSLGLHGNGVVLNMENEEHRRLFAIFSLSDQWKGAISDSKENRYSGSRFYFENPEMEAQKYLADEKLADELVDAIRGLDNDGVERISLWFSLTGSLDLKKATLRKMTKTAEGRLKLGEILYNPDREILELIAVAQSKGSQSTKEGLWVNQQNGIYYWNQVAIGVGKAPVITHLKANPDLYHSMKQMYMKLPEERTEVKVDPKNAAAMAKNAKQLSQPVDDTQLLADWKTGQYDFAALGRKHGKHWTTIKKRLKELGE